MWCSVALVGLATLAPNLDDPKQGKKLVFKDEFTRPGVPSSKDWVPEVGMIRNHEAQFYTNMRRENVRKENGNLIIEARKEKWEKAEVTSASITTRKAYTYGYFEIRAKVPVGRGTWPAIWMLGEAIRLPGKDFVGWPLCGEIDIMEQVGYDPAKFHFTVHVDDRNNTKGTPRTAMVEVPDTWKDFHTYGLDWNKDRLDFYFDGKKVMTYANDGQGERTWPFHRPAYLLINLAIGGDWGGNQGIDDSIFPSQYLIDYVRIYQ